MVLPTPPLPANAMVVVMLNLAYKKVTHLNARVTRASSKKGMTVISNEVRNLYADWQQMYTEVEISRPTASK